MSLASPTQTQSDAEVNRRERLASAVRRLRRSIPTDSAFAIRTAIEDASSALVRTSIEPDAREVIDATLSGLELLAKFGQPSATHRRLMLPLVSSIETMLELCE